VAVIHNGNIAKGRDMLLMMMMVIIYIILDSDELSDIVAKEVTCRHC